MSEYKHANKYTNNKNGTYVRNEHTDRPISSFNRNSKPDYQKPRSEYQSRPEHQPRTEYQSKSEHHTRPDHQSRPANSDRKSVV